MNYKETLFFIGKCLTITHEKHNKDIVEKELKLNNINWEDIVKVSTSHYVFPALYCNLKRADFLHYLPEDLVDYMKHITDLNRERNLQIIAQAKEINSILLANNITPIFLKGTGNLLEGLYEDIGERMVGDIDFLVKKKESKKAFNILCENNYNYNSSGFYKDHRHLPRIINKNKIAAVEIHTDMLREQKSKFFNFNTIKNSIIEINKIHTLSLIDQIKLTVFSKLINDNSYIRKNINLRAAYDTFLLGNKLTKKRIIKDSNLHKELNAGLLLYTTLLAKPKNLDFSQSTQDKYYTEKCFKLLENNLKNKTERKIYITYIYLRDRISIILKSFYKKNYFNFIVYKFSSLLNTKKSVS